MSVASKDVLLVGSSPFETVEEMLRTCADKVGDQVFALPDGEVGLRATWIGALPHLTYEKSPDLEQIKKVAPEDVKSPEGHGPELLDAMGLFRIKPGVTEPRFDLHFGHAAVESYETFKRLRDEGLFGKHIRFQVGLPFTSDGVDLFFPEPADRPIAYRAYERCVQDAIALLLKHIPADDLVIQWDYCTEVINCIGAFDDRAPEGTSLPALQQRFEYLTSKEYVSPLSDTIPNEVIVGYHLCFGTWGGWPIAKVLDIDLLVRMANRLVANTPHRIDYVHLPGMPDPPENFWTPLANLDIGDTKVFLGIELADGEEALIRRAEQAREFLPEFGIAHYCGYGREEPQRVRELLDDISRGAARLATSKTS